MQIIEALRALGGFAGIAALLAVLPQLASIKRNTAKTAVQVENHESGLKSQISRLEANIDSDRESAIMLRKEVIKRLDGHDREFREIKDILKKFEFLT